MRLGLCWFIVAIVLLCQGRVYALPSGCDSTTVPGSALYGNTGLCGLYTSVSGGYTFSAQKLSVANDPDGINYDDMHSNNTLAPMATSALGYDFYRNFQIPMRMEFAYAYQGKYTQNRNVAQFDSTTGQILAVSRDYQYQNQTLFYNAYYDWHTSWLTQFVPYIGLGVGLAENRGRRDVSQADLSEHHGIAPAVEHWAPAWNTALGADYFLSSHWAIGTQWRLANLGWHDLIGTANAAPRSDWIANHTLTSDIALLVRYEF